MKLKCEYVPIGQHKLASSSTLETSTPSPTTPDMPFRADLYSTGSSNQWASAGSGGDQVFVAQPSAAATTSSTPLAYDPHPATGYPSNRGEARYQANYAGTQAWVSSSLPTRSYTPAPSQHAYALEGQGERSDSWLGSRLPYPVSQSTPSSPAIEARGYPAGQQALDGGLNQWRQLPPATSQWREGSTLGTLGGASATAGTTYPTRMDAASGVQQYYSDSGWT